MLSPFDPSWFSDIEAPHYVDNANDLTWHDQADVVVVGLGAAGVCAAIEALDNQVTVIAIERFQGGGDTALSNGVVYLGGGTPYQHDAGYKDDIEQMFNYLKLETEGVVEDTTLRKFCEGSVDSMKWLECNGVEFAGVLSSSPANNNSYLHYSGNETISDYANKATPAPRGHRVFGQGISGNVLYQQLKQSALQKGVVLKSQNRVNRLIVDNKGTVIGVGTVRLPEQSIQAKQHRLFSFLANKFRLTVPPLAAFCCRKLQALENSHVVEIELIRANNAVILAAGGFVINREMVNQYAPKYSGAQALGNTGCNGNGIRLGQSVGGTVDRMNSVSAWRFINPPLAWIKGIIVNDQGNRYCNEQVYAAKLGYHMVEENDGRATLILNRDLYWQAIKQLSPAKINVLQLFPALLCAFLNVKKAKTIEDLAYRCGLPEYKLKETIDTYNHCAAGEQKDAFGKSEECIQGMFSGPYYAMDISVDTPLFPCPSITLGGLRVDERSGLVKNEQGKLIKGLYAAGRNAVGIASNFYVGGLSIADCVFSGRRAGRHGACNGVKR